MADSKKTPQLDKGFEDVPLDKGFQEIPLSDEDQQSVSKYISKPEVGMGESARAGFANGGTFGFAPRIGAAGGAVAEKAAQAMGMGPQAGNIAAGQNPQSMQDLYNEYLKMNNQKQEAAKAANPITYGASQLVGGIASPLNKIGAVGQLGKNAPMVSKMANGALAGTKMGLLAGASQSKDLTDLPQTAQQSLEGGAMGAGLGALTPPAGAAIKGLASGAANMVRPLIGKPGEMMGKGLQAGMEGAPNLAGEPGQLQAIQDRGQFADQFVQDLHNVLAGNAKNKRQLIADALAKSQLAPKDAVRAVFDKYLEANPQLNEETARKELAHLKDMIITASEGPEVEQTTRTYHNAAAQPTPAPGPGAQFTPPLNGPGEVLPPESAPQAGPPPGQDVTPPPQAPPPPAPQLGAGGQNMPAPQAQEPITGTAEPMGAPRPETPSDFQGYEAVHKATIKKGDKEARAAFEQKIHEKLADEEALGQNHNDNPIQIEEKPIPGSDNVRLIAKRAVQAEDGNEFKEQARALTQQQKDQQRLQDLLDRQNEEKMKMQQQHETELAKPQFTDETRMVRQGGRNIQDPQELYNLQQNLKAKSQFSEGRGFSSQEMNKMSGDAAKDIAQLIKLSVPETVPVDERLNAFNNVAESLGLDTDKLSLSGGEGQKARQDAMKKILGVLNPESPTDKSQLSQKSIDYVQQQLNRVHPDIGEAFGQEAAKHAENAGTIAQLTKPETVGGGGPILSSVRRGLNKAAYNTGHAVGSEINKMKPGMDKVQTMFQNYTPEALQKAGAAASQSTNEAVQKMGQVLSKLATADDRTRNSMMFVLEQQAGYRQLMSPYFDKSEPGTPQAKDMHLEKYK